MLFNLIRKLQVRVPSGKKKTLIDKGLFLYFLYTYT